MGPQRPKAGRKGGIAGEETDANVLTRTDQQKGQPWWPCHDESSPLRLEFSIFLTPGLQLVGKDRVATWMYMKNVHTYIVYVYVYRYKYMYTYTL